MIAVANHLAQNCAAASLNQMGWISETTPTGMRRFAQGPVLTSLGSKPKLPRQIYARPRSITRQPVWVGVPAKTHLNCILSLYNKYLRLVSSLGGETHSYGVGGGRWRLRLAPPPPGSVSESFRILHSTTKEKPAHGHQ
jgi:hypothetical protein